MGSVVDLICDVEWMRDEPRLQFKILWGMVWSFNESKTYIIQTWNRRLIGGLLSWMEGKNELSKQRKKKNMEEEEAVEKEEKM